MAITLPIPYPTDGKLEKNTQAGWERDLWVPGSFDYDVYEDKFWGDLIKDEYPAAKTSGGGAITVTKTNSGSYVEVKSGTGSGDYAGQGFGTHWTGDRGCLAEFIIKTPATITNWKFEVGLTDADDDDGAVGVKATPTVTATDCAVFVYDTTDDSNIAFVSAKGGTAVATQDIQALVASTTYRLGIRVSGDNVEAYINGARVAGHGSSTGIEGGNGLTPWAFSEALTASEVILQLHKWRVTQPAY